MTEHDHVATDAEAPEADAREQALGISTDEDDGALHVSGDREAPEADAIEQAFVVTSPFDEDAGRDA
ncbi:MAG TPA: hypothetical protein VNA57_13755 [Acidimicrobiales bacterium]|nr:hypothetical protein [Acidimicrobiales bacterium]